MKKEKLTIEKVAPYAVLLALLIIAGLFQGGYLSSGITGLGTTPINVQTLDVQSSNAILNGKVMHIVSLADLTSRYMVGTLSVDAAAALGVFLERDFTLTDEIKSYVCAMQVRNTSYEVYNWAVASTTYGCCAAAPYSRSGCGGRACAGVGAPCGSGGTVISRTGGTGSEYWLYHETCQYPSRGSRVGSLQTIESTARTVYTIDHKIQVGDKSSSIILSSDNQVGQTEVMYARLMGNLQGWINCPVPPANYMAYRPYNTVNFQLKDNGIAQTEITACANVNSVSQASACNAAVSALLSNTVTDAFYDCTNTTFDGVATKMSCQPRELPAIPQIETFVKADWVGMVAPVGDPEIISIDAPPCEASAPCRATITAKNKGRFQDSFDFVIQGLTLTPVRAAFAPDEQKTVEVIYTSAGFIRKFNFTMTSINDPTKVAIKEQTLTLYPFCDENPPSPQHVRIMTALGCRYVCPKETLYYDSLNGWGKNIYEEDCIQIPDYPLSDDLIKEELENTGRQYHCTAIGKYIEIRKYLEDGMSFIPEYKEHQVWISSPVCNYVTEYGYKIESGVALPIADGYTFYEIRPIEGTDITPSGFTPVPQSDYQGTQEPSFPLIYVLPAGVAILGVGIAYVFFKKKK